MTQLGVVNDQLLLNQSTVKDCIMWSDFQESRLAPSPFKYYFSELFIRLCNETIEQLRELFLTKTLDNEDIINILKVEYNLPNMFLFPYSADERQYIHMDSDLESEWALYILGVGITLDCLNDNVFNRNDALNTAPQDSMWLHDYILGRLTNIQSFISSQSLEICPHSASGGDGGTTMTIACVIMPYLFPYRFGWSEIGGQTSLPAMLGNDTAYTSLDISTIISHMDYACIIKCPPPSQDGLIRAYYTPHMPPNHIVKRHGQSNGIRWSITKLAFSLSPTYISLHPIALSESFRLFCLNYSQRGMKMAGVSGIEPESSA